MITPKQKWCQMKLDTGQHNHTVPTLIREGKSQHTDPKNMSQALNRMNVKSIREIRNQLDPTDVNPMTQYKKFVGRDDLSFSFQDIHMSILSKTLDSMRATGFSSNDQISMWMLKQAKEFVLPLLQQLLTRILATGVYPTQLKTTKIVPALRFDLKCLTYKQLI